MTVADEQHCDRLAQRERLLFLCIGSASVAAALRGLSAGRGQRATLSRTDSA